MTKYQHKYQPGPVFQDAFLSGLRAINSSQRDFGAKHGVKFQALRGYATGHCNGPKAHKYRDLMIEEIGPDLFDAIYRRRMAQERSS